MFHFDRFALELWMKDKLPPSNAFTNLNSLYCSAQIIEKKTICGLGQICEIGGISIT